MKNNNKKQLDDIYLYLLLVIFSICFILVVNYFYAFTITSGYDALKSEMVEDAKVWKKGFSKAQKKLNSGVDKLGELSEPILSAISVSYENVTDSLTIFLENLKKEEPVILADTHPIEIIPEIKKERTTADGQPLLTDGTIPIIHYNQLDDRWASEFYGQDNTIGKYGCGPTALAIVISSMTSQPKNPVQMAHWANENGFFSENSGSYHSIIPNGLKSFGLKATSMVEYSASNILYQLNSGKIIVALMDEGHFTSGGHFLILRGTTSDGKILIADPQSLENSRVPWDVDIFVNEAKRGASSGGPMWIVEK